ncbi:PI31 proteasome regulator [Stagonosporopsis vannaccii]|nr:PI31 proteasome regulator [Stagonosporopsis vannaccii]
MVSDRTTGNPLSAGSLSLFMATALPRGDDAKLKNGTEAVALAVHAGMLAVGFRLEPLYTYHASDLRAQTLIASYADAENPNPLPVTWNASSLYTFRYKHAQSALDYHINVHKLGGKAAVSAIAIGDDRPKNFDVTTKEYLSESMLPLSISEDASTEDAAKKLMDLFISSGRLNDLGALLKISVIQKLAPSLQKAGYEEDSGVSNGRNAPARDDNSPPRPNNPPNPRQPQDPEPARPYPFNDPLAVPQQSGRPLPEPIPGFEDEYEVNRPSRGGLRDDRYPVGIGHDDLYPQGLGPNDPLRPHLGGGLPRPGGGFGGGMHPTFDDPLFRGQGSYGGYDPSAPPGARYDPVGPGGAPRDNRGGGGPRFPGGGGFGGPPNPFGGFGGNDFI